MRILLLFSAILPIIALLATTGLLLADRLMPAAQGLDSRALPTTDTSALDQAVLALLDAGNGESAALFLADNLDAFALRALSARAAGRSLDIQYYLWHDDLSGRLLAREALEAARRGVRVRILLDDINARGIDRALLALDEHPAIEVRLYNPFRNRKGLMRTLEMIVRAFRVNHRMHNKAWIADGRMAIVGGRNLGDEYFGAANQMNFRDLDMGLVGPVVTQAERVFDEYWNSAAAIPIRSLKKRSRIGLAGFAAKLEQSAGDQRAAPFLERVEASGDIHALLASDPELYRGTSFHIIADPPIKWKSDDRSIWMIDKLLPELAQAGRELLLISPYFVPGSNGSDGLVALQGRGVDTRVLTNSLAATDVAVVHAGYARYRPALLRGGVRLYEMMSRGDTHMSLAGSRGASLHTKAFLVDGQRGFVGSFNLDPRSANLNTEMGVLFDSTTMGALLEEEFRGLIAPQTSYEVSLDARGTLRWSAEVSGEPRVLDREPDARLPRRIGVWLLGWLPIESQL